MYEVVITNFHGNAFVRYRLGDLVEIVSMQDSGLNIKIPQMVFHARRDGIIAIGGFTRITEKFIPIAEESGLIVEIGAWVLEKACGQIHQWQKQTGMHTLKININISQRQFSQPEFLQQIQEVLGVTGLNPSSLNLEITEYVLMDNSDCA